MATTLARVADMMAVPASTALISQAVSMQGANAVIVSFLVTTMGGSSALTPSLEGSNDLTNWSSIATYSNLLAAGYSVSSSSSGIAFQYVRLKLSNAAGGTVILTADVSTASL